MREDTYSRGLNLVTIYSSLMSAYLLVQFKQMYSKRLIKYKSGKQR